MRILGFILFLVLPLKAWSGSVTGTWYTQDDQFRWQPVHHHQVYVVNQYNQIISRGQTDQRGNFNLYLPNNYINIRVLLESTVSINDRTFKVASQNYSPNTPYRFITPNYSYNGGQLHIGNIKAMDRNGNRYMRARSLLISQEICKALMKLNNEYELLEFMPNQETTIYWHPQEHHVTQYHQGHMYIAPRSDLNKNQIVSLLSDHFVYNQGGTVEYCGNSDSVSRVAERRQCAFQKARAKFLSLLLNNSPIWKNQNGNRYNVELSPLHQGPLPTGEEIEANIISFLWDLFDEKNEPRDHTFENTKQLLHGLFTNSAAQNYSFSDFERSYIGEARDTPVNWSSTRSFNNL